jgi:hypothetical protein
VPKEPSDPSTENDPDSVARRRERMREADEEHVTGTGELRRDAGATGIDMGAGGKGTDLSGQ